MAEGQVEDDADFPSNSIDWIFPWTAGVPTHVHAQLTAQYLSEELGVDVNVVALPGGAGATSAGHVMNQPADGYTMWDAWVAPLVFSTLIRDMGYTYMDWIVTVNFTAGRQERPC